MRYCEILLFGALLNASLPAACGSDPGDSSRTAGGGQGAAASEDGGTEDATNAGGTGGVGTTDGGIDWSQDTGTMPPGHFACWMGYEVCPEIGAICCEKHQTCYKPAEEPDYCK
jgi:hypothetical protein